MGIRFAAAAFVAVVAAPAAHAQLNKCVLGGKTVYQDSPCPDQAKASSVKPPDPPAARPLKPEEAKDAVAKAEAQARADLEAVADVLVGFTICSEAEGGFGGAQAAAFEGWKERNAGRITRFNQSPEGRRLLEHRLAAARALQQAGPAEAREARVELCGRTANAIRPLAPPK